jgi:type IV secretory pathway TrbF-like protein
MMYFVGWPQQKEGSRMKKLTKAEKQMAARISQAYNASCHGMVIQMRDLSRVSRVGEAAILAGATDEQLQIAIRDFVQSIRVN